jgi:hypothetical protein
MLKLTLLTTPLSSHAEIDLLPYPFPAMLKLTLLTTPFSSHAETYFIDHAPFQPC